MATLSLFYCLLAATRDLAVRRWLGSRRGRHNRGGLIVVLTTIVLVITRVRGDIVLLVIGVALSVVVRGLTTLAARIVLVVIVTSVSATGNTRELLLNRDTVKHKYVLVVLHHWWVWRLRVQKHTEVELVVGRDLVLGKSLLGRVHLLEWSVALTQVERDETRRLNGDTDVGPCLVLKLGLVLKRPAISEELELWWRLLEVDVHIPDVRLWEVRLPLVLVLDLLVSSDAGTEERWTRWVGRNKLHDLSTTEVVHLLEDGLVVHGDRDDTRVIVVRWLTTLLIDLEVVRWVALRVVGAHLEDVQHVRVLDVVERELLEASIKRKRLVVLLGVNRGERQERRRGGGDHGGEAHGVSKPEIEQYLNGRCIYLVGMMGSGKTTVGRVLSDALNYSFCDSDLLVEQNMGGMSVAEIFNQYGEGLFRDKESDALKELSMRNRSVISTGGGAVIRPINWKHMRKGVSVWLDVPLECLARRISAVGTNSRPLLHGDYGDAYSKALTRLSTLLEKRGEAYANANARVSLEYIAMKLGHVNVDNLTPAVIALEALEQIESFLKDDDFAV